MSRGSRCEEANVVDWLHAAQLDIPSAAAAVSSPTRGSRRYLADLIAVCTSDVELQRRPCVETTVAATARGSC